MKNLPQFFVFSSDKFCMMDNFWYAHSMVGVQSESVDISRKIITLEAIKG